MNFSLNDFKRMLMYIIGYAIIFSAFDNINTRNFLIVTLGGVIISLAGIVFPNKN